jgi:hypothetical protein
MIRCIALAAALLFCAASFNSRALTLEPLPGSTPQATCFLCVFPKPVGVIARDASGNALAGVQVTFTTTINELVMVHTDDLGHYFAQTVATTGPDGVATAIVLTDFHPASRAW